MTDVLTLPILSLPDLVVLPGMVVPVELDSDARAVIDAARAGSEGQLLLASRLADRYPVYGVSAEIAQGGGRCPRPPPFVTPSTAGSPRSSRSAVSPGASRPRCCGPDAVPAWAR